MTEKRFTSSYNGDESLLTSFLDNNKPLSKQEVLDLLNNFDSIELDWTQNHIEFDKDELYIKDNHTEIKLKDRNLHISVFIPQIEEHLHFHYIVTGRRLEREYNTLNSGDGND